MLGFLTMFSVVSAQDCSELFISEYLEGSGNNKGVEVYNPTSEIINLGDYYIARYSNGSNTYTGGGITQLQGFLQPYGTHFLVNGQTTSTDTSPASDPNLRAKAQQLDHDYPAPTYMNGNDAIALFKKIGNTGTDADYKVVDLFGIVGGGMPSDGQGWASFTDQWVYKNIYDGDVVIGQDSVYISNYIVPATYYWLPWTSNHSLVRKPGVKQGITVETMPTVEFVVTTQWDTVPGGVDQWDSLNAHYCDCEFATAIELGLTGPSLSVYPNPAEGYVTISSDEGIDNLQVMDLSGKILLSLSELKGTREKTIDMDDFDQGIYLIRARSGNSFITRKLVKQ